MSRDYGAELDALKTQLSELERLVRQMGGGQAKPVSGTESERPVTGAESEQPVGGAESEWPVTGTESERLVAGAAFQGGDAEEGAIYFSGYYRNGGQKVRCEPQERKTGDLLGLNRGKAAKVLSALAHKQRLDLLLEVWNEPLTGAELVERLNLGTTGQLYHHLKALTGSDLMSQEERGGRYTVSAHRRFPLLVLLSAVSDLMDASDYMDLLEARNEAHAYLGAATPAGYDIHQPLWALVNNSLEEHQAGYCSEVGIFLHDDFSVTVTDNGRGIPIRVLPHSGKPAVQTLLTKIGAFGGPEERSAFFAPGAEKEIGIAVVNALSRALSVEIRRDGGIYRQEYRHGIPQTGLRKVGVTQETGTSITFTPEPELFAGGFEQAVIDARVNELQAQYPQVRIGTR